MPGISTTGALNDSLPTMRMGARLVVEQVGRIRDTVDRIPMPHNMGNTWSEVDYAQMTASTISETTDLEENPEQISDTLRTIAPGIAGIHILYTDLVADRILAQGAAIVRSGILGMNSILRRQDLDGIVQGRSATTDLGTAGNPLTSSLIRHGRYRISSNVTEANQDGPFHLQHHGFVLADIEDEMSAPLGTYEITAGLTREIVEKSLQAAPRMLGGVFIHENGHMTIDSSDDCEGFLYARDGLILIEDGGVRAEVKRRAEIGDGATSVFMTFRYGWGFRSAGNWLFSMTADALAPS